MNENAILETIRHASFIFAGTVTAATGSSLQVLPVRPGLAVVRFERGFLVNPMLGKPDELKGRPITVRLAREGAGASAVRSGERLLFFTTAWVHAEQVAVNELARLPADENTEQQVAKIVASLPQRHLSERVASAVLIVHGTVGKLSRATDIPGTGTEHDPGWMRAPIEAREVLKGKAVSPPAPGRGRKPATVVLLFPGSRDRAFRDVPRPSSGQSAVFLLHQAPSILPAGSLIAPDPADIQPENELATIRRLLSNPDGPTTSR